MAAKGKATGEDDNDFDSFVEPAGLILSTVIGMMPGEYHDKARLLREAQKMKLPGNPLVRPSPCTCLSATACHLVFCQRGISLIASLLHSDLLSISESTEHAQFAALRSGMIYTAATDMQQTFKDVMQQQSV